MFHGESRRVASGLSCFFMLTNLQNNGLILNMKHINYAYKKKVLCNIWGTATCHTIKTKHFTCVPPWAKPNIWTSLICFFLIFVESLAKLSKQDFKDEEPYFGHNPVDKLTTFC